MDETTTVRDVMTRAYVGVSEGDPVTGAAELMTEEGVDSVVVLRGSEPVGMLHASDVVALVAGGSDLEATPVDEAMAPVSAIGADEGISTALGAITSRDARGMVVVEGDEVVGLLTERDLITAQWIQPPAPEEADEPLLAAGVEEGPSIDEEFTAQGVCEVCGSLVRDLTNDNGQLVCTDCLEM